MTVETLPSATLPSATLHVCVTCRAGREIVDGAPRPGRDLFNRLLGAAPDGVTVLPVECLARCDAGCTAALTAPDRWTLLLGRLDETKAADLLAFVDTYRRSRTGTVMPSKRPASLGNTMLGRIPAAIFPEGPAT